MKIRPEAEFFATRFPIIHMSTEEELSNRTLLNKREAERHFELQSMLLEFARLFDYNEENDRAVAIVGPAFLDTLLTEMLVAFLVDDEKETLKLLQPEGPLGTFGAKVSMCYSLGLIGKIVRADLKLVAKIRNRFAHDVRAGFSDGNIAGWCRALRWHKELFPNTPPAATDRDLFQVGVHQLVAHLHGLVSLARIHRRREFQPGCG